MNTPKDFDIDIPDLETLLPILLGDTSAIPNGYDVETFVALMDDKFNSLPKTDKRELIHFLYNLCEIVIGIQFGVDPTQISLRAQKETSQETADSMAKLKPTHKTTFGRVATGNQSSRRKG